MNERPARRPPVAMLHRSGMHRGLAALGTELLLLAALLGVVYLVVRRALQQFNDLQGTVNRGFDRPARRPGGCAVRPGGRPAWR